MLADSPVVAFVPSRDLKRSSPFFADTLGLKLIESDEFALLFDANGTALRVTAVPNLTPHPFTVLGWTVADIQATVTGLAKRGVAFERFDGMKQDSLGIWVAPGGAKVAWFKDPDGNVLSVTQMPE
jgi:catechol 2,3-dioxygenase-like lactoylglutathione lyase family enzyme